MNKIKIDKEFERLIPPLSPDEFATLEDNILKEGIIRDPLVLWGEVLVDGHNRFRILKKHPEIYYQTIQMEFDDRYAAKVWICSNQLGRRNLTPAKRRYLIGKRYEAEKMSHGGCRKSSDYAPIGEKTANRIARVYDTSPKTVLRASQFAKAVDLVEISHPGTRDKILQNRIPFTTKDAIAVLHGESTYQTTVPAKDIQTDRIASVTNTDINYFRKSINAVLCSFIENIEILCRELENDISLVLCEAIKSPETIIDRSSDFGN